MNKGRIFALAVLMTALVGGFAMATVPTPVNIELIADYATSYRVAPTDSVLAFLAKYGVDVNLPAKELGREIGKLDTIIVEDSLTDETYSVGSMLDIVVNSALLNASTGITDPVFMDLGTVRWVLQK